MTLGPSWTFTCQGVDFHICASGRTKEAKLVCGLISREHRFGLGPSRIVRVVWESACLQNRGVVGRDTVCSWSWQCVGETCIDSAHTLPEASVNAVNLAIFQAASPLLIFMCVCVCGGSLFSAPKNCCSLLHLLGSFLTFETNPLFYMTSGRFQTNIIEHSWGQYFNTGHILSLILY